MPMKMGRGTYERLVEEDLEWLFKQPQTLERDHIAQIVRESVNFYYPRQDAAEKGTDVPDSGSRIRETHRLDGG